MAYERIFPKVNKPSGRKYAHTKCDGNNARRGQYARTSQILSSGRLAIMESIFGCILTVRLFVYWNQYICYVQEILFRIRTRKKKNNRKNKSRAKLGVEARDMYNKYRITFEIHGIQYTNQQIIVCFALIKSCIPLIIID